MYNKVIVPEFLKKINKLELDFADICTCLDNGQQIDKATKKTFENGYYYAIDEIKSYLEFLKKHLNSRDGAVAGFYIAFCDSATEQNYISTAIQMLATETRRELKLFNIVRDAGIEFNPDHFNLGGNVDIWHTNAAGILKVLKFFHSYILNNLPEGVKLPDKNISDLLKQCEKNKAGIVKPTQDNLDLIFDKDPNLKDLIGYDHYTDSTVFLKKPFWKSEKFFEKFDLFTDSDTAEIRKYLRKNYSGLNCPSMIDDQLTSLANSNEFNRAQDWFSNFPDWDGVPRAETLFIKYLRVADTPFVRKVTLNWLLGAVARLFHPGCDFQTTLILHGNQGIGKSRMLTKLGGEFYVALQDALDDSHAEDALNKAWIVELKELSSMKKTDISRLKGFLDVSEVTRRWAFEKRASTRKRHCVFAGTVNDPEFLRDQTGNRRFAILHSNLPANNFVEGFDEQEARQVWAEVYQIYCEMMKDGFDDKKIQLPYEIKKQIEEIAEEYIQDDGLLSEIKAFVDRKILPNFIWQLLNKEERRKYFVDGKLYIVEADLNTRIRATFPAPKAQEIINQLYSFLNDGCDPHNANQYTRKAAESGAWYIYGTVNREHICAAEILSECFGTLDRRVTVSKISEVLHKLDGWQVGRRLQKVDAYYPDQRKPYYRI